MTEEKSDNLVSSLKDWLTTASGIGGLFFGLVRTANDAGASVPVPLRRFLLEGWVGWLLVVVLLAVFSLRWWGGAARRAPRVRNMAVFQIRRKFLEGRDQDIENVAQRLETGPLVFLYGESGAGKSALLEKGLMPRLLQDPSLLPLLVENWGADVARGPREALTRALNNALDATALQKVGAKDILSGDSGIDLLETFRETTGRIPILLFDQFDDYQLRHRDYFVRGSIRKLLTARELIAENPFWNRIAAMVRDDRARCLFVTRDDAAWGLDSVRFSDESQPYLLKRIEAGYAAALLDTITSGDAIINAERGFEDLKRRLISDLSGEDTVLPIRMVMAFRALPRLSPLTLSRYDAEGGLSGLEAAHIKSHVGEAARAVGWSPNDVRLLLSAMVDPAFNKTTARTEQDLLSRLPSGRRNATELATVLDALKDAELVRARVDQDSGQRAWLLDHDYLCRAVLELERKSERWTRALQDAATAYASAAGVAARWQHLLSPSLQLRLGYERVRGRLRYGPFKSFAFLSLPRLFANAWLLVFALIGYLGYRVTLGDPADRIFTSLGLSGDSFSPEEVSSLWNLSQSGEVLRTTVLEKALHNPNDAARFNSVAGPFLQASVGLDTTFRQQFIAGTFDKHCVKEDQVDDAVLLACANTGAALDIRTPEARAIAIKVIKHSRRLTDLRYLARTVTVWKTENDLDQSFVDNLASALLQHLSDAPDVDTLVSIVSGLALLGSRLPATAAELVTERLMEPLEDHLQSTNALGQIAPSDAEALISALPARFAVSLSRRLSSAALATDDPERLQVISFWAAAYKKRPEEYTVAFEAIGKRTLELMRAANEPRRVVALCTALGLLKDAVPTDLADAAINLLLQQLKGSTDLDSLAPLSGQLGMIVSSLPPADIPRRVELLASELASVSNKDVPSGVFLGIALSRLAKTIPPGVGERVTESLASSLRPGISPELAEALVRIPSMLGRSTSAKTAETVIGFAISRVEVATGKADLQRFTGFVTKEFGAQLAPASAKELSRRLLRKMSSLRADDEGFPSMANDLGWISSNLDDQTADATLKEFMAVASRSTRPRCGAAASLIREATIPIAIQLIRWPHCSTEDRDQLIERVGELTHENAFGAKGPEKDDPYVADVWRFAAWAEKRGHAVRGPLPIAAK